MYSITITNIYIVYSINIYIIYTQYNIYIYTVYIRVKNESHDTGGSVQLYWNQERCIMMHWSSVHLDLLASDLLDFVDFPDTD